MSRMRDQDKLQKRSDYVKRIVSKATSTQNAVEKLAKKLFVSESTIYKDLAK